MRQWSQENADIDREWFERSNHIGFLSVTDESALLKLIDTATKRNIKYSIFFEPDLDYAITAVTFAPGVESKKMLSNIGLALKEKS